MELMFSYIQTDYLHITGSTQIFIDLDIYNFVTFFNSSSAILKLAMY